MFEIFISAYRFQIAGYRDEIEYKAFKKVEQVKPSYNFCKKCINTWCIAFVKATFKGITLYCFKSTKKFYKPTEK